MFRKIGVGFIILVIAVGFFVYTTLSKRTTNIPSISSVVNQKEEDTAAVAIIAKNLEVPWALAFLPSGELLVTERAGRVRLIIQGTSLQEKLVLQLQSVKQIGEGGLHGIAVHPQFILNKYVYLYYTYGQNGNQTLNRVSRFSFENNTLSNETIIVDKIPGAMFHDGGRIKFGPDNFLYITTGDAQEPSRSQDKNSLAGKILRVTDTGDPAPGNPFNTRVYSYGHRNPQGITWDENKNLWSTEHGASATDELNKIEPGKNYGWPTLRGDDKQNGFAPPIIHSANATWAPAGAAYLNGSVFFGGLRGTTLYEAVITNGSVRLKEHFKGEFGRIREVIVGPDNMLYITTSNRDGRGVPSRDDDKIIRVNPKKLSGSATASFSIFTNGTKRIFTDSKYHNRSVDVYIQADDPSVIHVTKKGITWQQFFDTLPSPMKVTKDCLATGTNQLFCTHSTSSGQAILTFTLNENIEPNALEQEIKDGDSLVISYESK